MEQHQLMAGTSNSGGRNRKSAEQHRLEGTYQKSRHAEASPAAAPPGRPTAPASLVGVGLVEWDRMVDRLELSRTLSRVDDAALYQYCRLFAETEAIAVAPTRNGRLIAKLYAAIEQLQGSELVDAIAQIVQLKKLEVKYAQQLRQGHMALRQWLVEFGLTPAARSRVKAAPVPDTKDSFNEFDAPAEGPTH